MKQTYQQKCMKCGYEWNSRTEHPKRCTLCNNPNPDKPKVRKTAMIVIKNPIMCRGCGKICQSHVALARHILHETDERHQNERLRNWADRFLTSRW